MERSPNRPEVSAGEPGLERLSSVASERKILLERKVLIVMLGIIFVGGFGLRTAVLGRVPLGFNQDEACNGYDAYSLLETGRDHHGNRLPLAIQAFNDYRMPLYDYSLAPLVALFGLKPATIRFGAALWGMADLAGVMLLAWMLLGLRAAAVAGLLTALSPWHLALSRFGIETMSASATVTLGTAALLRAVRRRRGAFILLGGLLFGISFYSYSITKAFTPLMACWIAYYHGRELWRMRRYAIGALLIVVACGLPQAIMILRHSAEMQARFNQISVFGAAHGGVRLVEALFHGYVSQFGPDFLFLKGDWYRVIHPPLYGQLLPVQAVLIALGLIALAGPRYRGTGLFLIGWLALAAIPGALCVPAPHCLHDALAMTPLTLLSALGLIFLIDFTYAAPLPRLAAALLLIIVLAEGVRFASFYFGDYPAVAARDFQYGVAEAIREANRMAGPKEPIVITSRINQPYIYELFFGPYPPALFQHGRVFQARGLFGPVYAFDRYAFVDPGFAFARLPHGIFVFAGGDATPVAPFLTIRYPDGGVAYSLCRK